MRGLLSDKKQTLPNYRRIKSSEEFKLALNAQFCNNKWFTIHARENKAGVSRLGIIVGKRVSPLSVSRNFVKRLIREEFRRDFPVRCALDIIVRLRRPLSRETAHDGQKALAQLLSDIKIKCVNF
ncbi:MAG: ribonuclease P protein component [Sideroxydans sp.]|nr:ribonuclease P protein component [Sideroxydans sp.]